MSEAAQAGARSGQGGGRAAVSPAHLELHVSDSEKETPCLFQDRPWVRVGPAADGEKQGVPDTWAFVHLLG